MHVSVYPQAFGNHSKQVTGHDLCTVWVDLRWCPSPSTSPPHLVSLGVCEIICPPFQGRPEVPHDLHDCARTGRSLCLIAKKKKFCTYELSSAPSVHVGFACFAFIPTQVLVRQDCWEAKCFCAKKAIALPEPGLYILDLPQVF